MQYMPCNSKRHVRQETGEPRDMLGKRWARKAMGEGKQQVKERDRQGKRWVKEKTGEGVVGERKERQKTWLLWNEEQRELPLQDRVTVIV